MKDSTKAAAKKEESKHQGGKRGQAPAAAVLVTENKGRKMKRGKIVRRAIDASKAKPAGKKDKNKEQNKATAASLETGTEEEPPALPEEAKDAALRKSD